MAGVSKKGELISTLDSSFLVVTIIYHTSELNVKWFFTEKLIYFLGIYDFSQNETFLKKISAPALSVGRRRGRVLNIPRGWGRRAAPADRYTGGAAAQSVP